MFREGKNQLGRRAGDEHWNDVDFVARESDEGDQSDELAGELLGFWPSFRLDPNIQGRLV